MNCREARNSIALWVGQDLDDPARVEQVRRHVASCPECRVHCRRLKQAMVALERADVPPTYEVRDSLWPVLSSRLVGPRVARPGEKRRWLPVVSFVAACTVLVAIVQFDPLPTHHARGNQPPLARGTLPGFGDMAVRANREGQPTRDHDEAERSPQKPSPAD